MSLPFIVINRQLDEWSYKAHNRAGAISNEDLQHIQQLTQQSSSSSTSTSSTGTKSRSQVEQTLSSDPKLYVSLLVRLLNALNKRPDAVQYVLVMIGDAVTAQVDESLLGDDKKKGGKDAKGKEGESIDRISLFISDSEALYPTLLKLSTSEDRLTKLKSISLLSTFINSDPSVPTSTISEFLDILADLTRPPREASAGSGAERGQTNGGGGNNGGLEEDVEKDVGVQSLQGVFGRQEVRKEAWKREEESNGENTQARGRVISNLVVFLRIGSSSPQMQYQIAFCFWVLSFDKEIAAGLNKKFKVVQPLMDLGKAAVKEKVLRVVLATFRNLVENAPEANLPAMLVSKLLPYVKSLSDSRKLTDEEVQEDLQYLQTQLKDSFEGLTTWDEYTSELKSGQLTWSPVHETDDFWRENAAKLNDKDGEQLKALVQLLMSSQDPTILSIAANDVAQYVKHCESGKEKIAGLGAKAKVMELMTHPNSDVKYHALVAAQRLISMPSIA